MKFEIGRLYKHPYLGNLRIVGVSPLRDYDWTIKQVQVKNFLYFGGSISTTFEVREKLLAYGCIDITEAEEASHRYGLIKANG